MVDVKQLKNETLLDVVIQSIAGACLLKEGDPNFMYRWNRYDEAKTELRRRLASWLAEDGRDLSAKTEQVAQEGEE